MSRKKHDTTPVAEAAELYSGPAPVVAEREGVTR